MAAFVFLFSSCRNLCIPSPEPKIIIVKSAGVPLWSRSQDNVPPTVTKISLVIIFSLLRCVSHGTRSALRYRLSSTFKLAMRSPDVASYNHSRADKWSNALFVERTVAHWERISIRGPILFRCWRFVVELHVGVVPVPEGDLQMPDVSSLTLASVKSWSSNSL
jgi:hypothetical protein